MRRIILLFICLLLFFGNINFSDVSAAKKAPSPPISSTSINSIILTSCLQQEYLMKDLYINVLNKYPDLPAFKTVLAEENLMINNLKKLFIRYKISIPADSQGVNALAIFYTITDIYKTDQAAIDLEVKVSNLMTQLLSFSGSKDVMSIVSLIKNTSLNSHANSFVVEQKSIGISQERVVSFSNKDSVSTFLTYLADESIDIIEMENGTYHLPCIYVDINRVNPIMVRPALGAVVILSGDSSGGNPQFMFGYNASAGNITMQNLIFDSFVLRKQGIVQGFNCHDITLNDMIVRNSRADGSYSQPYQAWAIYLIADSVHHPINFIANHWTVDVVDRQMSGVKICGGTNIILSDWSIFHAYFAVYGGGSLCPLSNFVLDNWVINDVGGSDWGFPNMSIGIADAGGKYSNIHLISSGKIVIDGIPRMVNGGGNTCIVGFSSEQTSKQFLELLADESINVIEMADGTYNLPVIKININRLNPIVVRPASGATVIFSGTNHLDGEGQFEFGYNGFASNITMQGMIFDNYTLGQIGVIWIGNAKNIVVNEMTVRNCKSNGTTAQPYHSWALYISYNNGIYASNIIANNWTVSTNLHSMSALQVSGNRDITANNWTVSNAYFAVYAENGQNLIIDNWAIENTLGGEKNISVYFNSTSGKFSNVIATNSGILNNSGTPIMTDAGGNSLLLVYGLRTVSFSPTDSSLDFLALLSDETISTIEMKEGTYHLNYMVIDIDRKNPILIKPAEGSSVIWKGDKTWGDPQITFGEKSPAGNITMEGITFDGYTLNQQGIIQGMNLHDISLNNMIVKNSKCNWTYSMPYHVWAIYLSSNATVWPRNFSADNWTIDGNNRQMSGLTLEGGSNLSFTNWKVSNTYFAAYVNAKGYFLSGLKLDNWNVNSCGSVADFWGTYPSLSFAFEYASGVYSNIKTVASGDFANVGSPKMSDGGGCVFEKGVLFSPSDTKAKFLSLLSDESVSVIELTDGTYHLPYIGINIDRKNPILVKPINGATVVFSGSEIGGDPQFMFGEQGPCGNITMEGFIFDGYVLAQQGIIQGDNCHDITLNNMTVRNSKCNGTYALPYHSWAIYLSETATTRPVNFTANNWTVDCSGRQMGAFQIYGGLNITAKNWNVTGTYYAIYASGGSRGPNIENLVLDNWVIKDSGQACWGHENVSVAVEYASGSYNNMTLISSGEIMNVGTPKLLNGENNTVQFFTGPIISRIVRVPESLDNTGITDVSNALNLFVESTPDGSVISFPAGAIYRLDKGIQFTNRHNLVFDGNGSTLKVGTTALGGDQLASSFCIGHQYGGFWEGMNSDIVIRNFNFIGNSPTPGVFIPSLEHLASFEVSGGERIEIYNCSASSYYGDFVKIGGSDSVWVHDNKVLNTGRNSCSVISGNNILIENNSFGKAGYCVFDIEPNDISEAVSNVKIINNTAASWSCNFFSVEGSHTGALISDIWFGKNIATESTIETVINNGGTSRMKNITFIDNTGTKAVFGPILIFAHIDGLTVKGNIQPLKGGGLINISDCTNIIQN